MTNCYGLSFRAAGQLSPHTPEAGEDASTSFAERFTQLPPQIRRGPVERTMSMPSRSAPAYSSLIWSAAISCNQPGGRPTGPHGHGGDPAVKRGFRARGDCRDRTVASQPRRQLRRWPSFHRGRRHDSALNTRGLGSRASRMRFGCRALLCAARELRGQTGHRMIQRLDDAFLGHF